MLIPSDRPAGVTTSKTQGNASKARLRAMASQLARSLLADDGLFFTLMDTADLLCSEDRERLRRLLATMHVDGQ